ncbi:unnamed protein product [Clonostachys rhizophaga]|uniref:Ubiquitin carboxyl-terminal hydrolase 19 n=1 Tax=Clonostachys rhizophaga TaxID=160324 RepID=A0A9P0ELR5_9HYPO|nr:unnamed protein product [Clonostachys rhizophaga]
MDPHFVVTREDLYNLQMEVKQVQYAQANHADRITKLEKRQADDAALKSVWNSPFPGVLSGTPQHGPVSQEDLFDDLDEQGEQLLNSLHLGPAEEEPTRRGAASRANSVRFDESALHGSSWAGHNNRHSGDFGPARPASSLMMERSLSHKSDGRHSSAGHSVHSHHSVASGRASSLGLDTTFAVEDDDDSSLSILEPPTSLFVLGSVPSIVRCWLTTNFAHNSLLYADVCTGSQKSTVDFSLIKELGLADEVQRDMDGTYRARLNVYFAEATILHHSRSANPERPVPSMTVAFEVVGMDMNDQLRDGQGIRIYVGSDALRLHSADILFSQNTMLLYGSDRSRLRVPFVRPEDDAVFKHICTANLIPGKPRLNANAAPFVLGDLSSENNRVEYIRPTSPQHHGDDDVSRPNSPLGAMSESTKDLGPSSASEAGLESDKSVKARTDGESSIKEGSITSESSRKEPPSGIWGPWRQGGTNGADGSPRETGPLSGYQPAARPSRNMKVLKPQKSTSARTGSSYEPAPSTTREGGEGRRKSQAGLGESISNGNIRWDAKRAVSYGPEAKSSSHNTSREARNSQTLPKVANPVGGASAFSWMAPPPKPKV